MARPLSLSTFASFAAFAVVVTACGPTEDLATPSSMKNLPRWEGPIQELFDDTIDPAAVGLLMDGSSPRAEPLLRERAKTADVVAQVKVTTVTVDSIGDEKTYHLVIQVGTPQLAAPRIPDRSFELLIRPSSRAFGIARAFDARLQGSTFVGFIKRFAGSNGEPEIHWHLSADTPEVVAAVKDAVALAELSGS